jgi:hypothetical protein
MVDDNALIGTSRKLGNLADLCKGFCINNTKHIRLPLWSASVLHVKVFVYRVVHAVIHPGAQFESVHDLVFFTINQFDGIDITSVRNDKTVGFGQISHREGLAEALDTVNPLSRPELEHFDCLLIFGGKE